MIKDNNWKLNLQFDMFFKSLLFFSMELLQAINASAIGKLPKMIFFSEFDV